MAIVDSGDPYIAYADAGGEYLSAFAKPKPDPLVQGRSISIRGPGCGTGDACAIGAYKYGYYGTGQKSVSLTGITSLTAGTNNTTWWYSATKGYNIKPNGQLVLAAKTSFVSITRS